MRGLLHRHRNADFRMGTVRRVDLDARRVVTDEGEVPYDYLVLSAGSRAPYSVIRAWRTDRGREPHYPLSHMP